MFDGRCMPPDNSSRRVYGNYVPLSVSSMVLRPTYYGAWRWLNANLCGRACSVLMGSGLALNAGAGVHRKGAIFHIERWNFVEWSSVL